MKEFLTLFIAALIAELIIYLVNRVIRYWLGNRR